MVNEFKNVESFQGMFESKVDIKGEDECWNWTGCKSKAGYGQFLGQYAHRIAYEMYTGERVYHLHVLHRCDNPSCVNPSHLFLGTHADNMRDMKDKGRSRNGSTGPIL